MSSMRNAVQRRNHKERSQPHERAKWGLLEKRKDYSLRAKDHNAKKRKLKALQQKAAERNEDEFYFGMVRSQTQGGRKVSTRAEENSGGSGKSLSVDVVKLMKTQDCAYLRTVLQSTRRMRERLEQEVVLLETGASVQPGTGAAKLVFDDAGDAIKTTDGLMRGFDDEDEDEDVELDLQDLLALDEVEVEASADADSDSEDDQTTPEKRQLRRKRRRNLEVKQRQLDTLRTREQSLATALREVEDQRARMAGTVGGSNKAGIKFKARERKR